MGGILEDHGTCAMTGSAAIETHMEREFEFTKEDFDFLAKLAYAHTGIVLPPHKADMVYARVARRLRVHRISSVKAYCELLQSEAGVEEMGHLVNALTTNLTSFFRESHHFEHLAKHVLKPFVESRETRLRLWSAGCSAGAEPYSMAMTLCEHVPAEKRSDARILATDIDTTMLETAQNGEYDAEWIKKIPDALRNKYVLTAGRESEMGSISDPVRSLVRFKRLNLLEPWPMHGLFDAIFCRNVVIYFDKKTQSELFNRMADKLKPGGYMYIGHSETMNNVSERFKLVGTTAYQRVL